jgi:maltose alpha-D-glucosyltransferase/alpha-amylase
MRASVLNPPDATAETKESPDPAQSSAASERPTSPLQIEAREKDPFWYKNAIIYELHVRAFADSNADGIGDFPGLTQKLDYLHDLGVTALWLLPFYPSPLKDDGYDIADYYTINPIYGSLDDFKTFLAEAHKRGLRVITELVINHTSDQHPWFQKSRRAKPGDPWRDFYVWSDTPQKYKGTRIIFKDFEPSNWSWDHVAHCYYWHRFYAYQPDLNFDNPAVHEAVKNMLDFWLGMGVDGVRLDAIPYLYEREGTSCENLPETHAYLKTLRHHVDTKYGDRMLLAEANQWPEDAVSYFGGGKGDECHMAFHFPLMPRLFMAVRMEDRVPIIDIVEQTPAIPETSQWALFLRNHDELTLEMVTDEERDYMYRVYANDLKARINLGIRRRLAPLLGNDRKKIELLNLLLFSLPGTPVLYYGDEIGMGENIFLGDRNGVRTPMHWSSDKNAGFSRAMPHALYLPVILDPEYHYETVNVEAQQRNPHSLLWWMKRAIHLRQRWHAFGQGTIEFLQPENRKILAFVREFQQERIFVVANLSRFPQPVRLDLAKFHGYMPVELFGRTDFPVIEEKPYLLTLAPHSLFWFSLEPERATELNARSGLGHPLRNVASPGDWRGVLKPPRRAELENLLASYLHDRRWFGAKGRRIKSLHVREMIPVQFARNEARILIVAVDYADGEPEEYLLPITFAEGREGMHIEKRFPNAVIARTTLDDQRSGVLYDATCNPEFTSTLLDTIEHETSFPGQEGTLKGARFAATGAATEHLKPSLAGVEQSNTSILFADRLILKLFRKLECGVNPDLEVSHFLAGQNFPHTPKVFGALEYVRKNGEQLSLGMLAAFVPSSRNVWEYTLESLNRFYERVQSIQPESSPPLEPSPRSLATPAEVPSTVAAILGVYLESARLLGCRTAEMHRALQSDSEKRDFAPEAFTPFYQRALYQSMRNLVTQNLDLLRKRVSSLDEPDRNTAEKILGAKTEILRRLRAIHETQFNALRIRCHGDYHLGQVLYTGKDFVIIDFEGEPARPLGERRIKRSPMRDVAGMIRSFHYASHAALLQQVELGAINADQLPALRPWAQFWYGWVSSAFLRSYINDIQGSGLLPDTPAELNVLLYAHLLEKAVYELGYELNNRPDWAEIPLHGVQQLLEL